MSARAETLAVRFEEANQATIDLIVAAPIDALRRTCEAEGWTAAAVGAHVAIAQDFIIGRVRRIVGEEEFPPFDAAAFHERNARSAEANAHLSSAAVVALLQEHGALSSAYVRGLSEDDLDRTRLIPAMGENPVTAQQMIERVLIGHTDAHLQSLKQSLGQP